MEHRDLTDKEIEDGLLEFFGIKLIDGSYYTREGKLVTKVNKFNHLGVEFTDGNNNYYMLSKPKQLISSAEKDK